MGVGVVVGRECRGDDTVEQHRTRHKPIAPVAAPLLAARCSSFRAFGTWSYVVPAARRGAAQAVMRALSRNTPPLRTAAKDNGAAEPRVWAQAFAVALTVDGLAPVNRLA